MKNQRLSCLKGMTAKNRRNFYCLCQLYINKLGKTRKAAAYIKELVNINKDTHDFFNRLVIGEGLSDIEFGMYGYRANSIEELAIDVTDNKFLFVNCGVYFKWVLKTIKSID